PSAPQSRDVRPAGSAQQQREKRRVPHLPDTDDPQRERDREDHECSRREVALPLLCHGHMLTHSGEEKWPQKGTEPQQEYSPPLRGQQHNLSNQQGEIVKSDKSPSQIRNFEIADWTRLSDVQSEIPDLGFDMQDSSDFKIPSHRCLVSQVC